MAIALEQHPTGRRRDTAPRVVVVMAIALEPHWSRSRTLPVDHAHTVVLNDALYAGSGGRAMRVAGKGALTHAAVTIPEVWLRRLRDAPRLRRNMELRITITRDDGRGDDAAALQRFGPNSPLHGSRWQQQQLQLQQQANEGRGHGGSSWPHSVFMDGESGSGHQKQQHSEHFVEGGWDPAPYASEVGSAVRYEHDLASESPDGVVTLLVKPWFVRNWATDTVRFTFRGHWRADPSWVRVHAAVWERVALHESFRPGRDARHRCDLDGAPVCHSDRHFELVPLDESNIERADRMARLYYVDLGSPGPLGSADTEEMVRLRAENARLLALVNTHASVQARGQRPASPVTPRQVHTAERRFFSGSPVSASHVAEAEAELDRELGPLPRAPPSGAHRKTPSRKVVDVPFTPERSPQPLSSPTAAPATATHYHIQSATFYENSLQSSGATIVRGQGDTEPHFAIRVQPTPAAGARSPDDDDVPTSPISPHKQKGGRLAPLHVHTGESVAPTPHGHLNRSFTPAGAASALASPFRRAPLPSPAQPRLSPDADSDPFLAHYAPEVDHFSARPSPFPPSRSGSAGPNGVHFFGAPIQPAPSPPSLAHLPPLPPSTRHAQHARPSPFAYPGFVNTPHSTPFARRNNY